MDGVQEQEEHPAKRLDKMWLTEEGFQTPWEKHDSARKRKWSTVSKTWWVPGG